VEAGSWRSASASLHQAEAADAESGRSSSGPRSAATAARRGRSVTVT
jgi:hypothetical protein